MTIGHTAAFSLDVDSRVEWGWRSTGEVAFHVDHEATTRLQLHGGTCRGFEFPIAWGAGTKELAAGPVKAKIAWGPRLYGEVALEGGAEASVSRHERQSLLLRLPVAGAPQLVAIHRVEGTSVEASGAVGLAGEFGLKTGVELRGGPFELRAELGARVAGDVAAVALATGAARVECGLRLEMFAQVIGEYARRGVSAEAVASWPAYECPWVPAVVALTEAGVGPVPIGTPHEQARTQLFELLGAPDLEATYGCEIFEPANGVWWQWGDLAVAVDDDRSSDGAQRVEGWSVFGPDLPDGVLLPFGLVPGRSTALDVRREVPGVQYHGDERWFGGLYSLGALSWSVDERDAVVRADANLVLCD